MDPFSARLFWFLREPHGLAQPQGAVGRLLISEDTEVGGGIETGALRTHARAHTFMHDDSGLERRARVDPSCHG